MAKINTDRIVNKIHDAAMKKAASIAYRIIVKATPVKTGKARGSWHFDFNADSKGRLNPSGTFPAEEFASLKAQNFPPGTKVTIQSSLPYMEVLESGKGSPQAPRGIVKENMQHIASQIKTALEDMGLIVESAI